VIDRVPCSVPSSVLRVEDTRCAFPATTDPFVSCPRWKRKDQKNHARYPRVGGRVSAPRMFEFGFELVD
jgi:hypothetical protein